MKISSSLSTGNKFILFEAMNVAKVSVEMYI